MTSKTGTAEWAGADRHYRNCPDGNTRHWGPDGAAGALAWLTCDDGEICVLLAQRSKHVQQGGTWAFPGGAIDSDSDGRVEDSLSAAIRELTEEIAGQIKPIGLTGTLEAPCTHGCGWAYTSYVIRVQAQAGDVPFVQVARGASAWETDDVAWWPVASVERLDLHPAFAAAWPALRQMIGKAAG